jgi:hypothetical protein
LKANDPQGYDKPVNFVKGQTAEAKGESERTDEEEEELRLQKKDSGCPIVSPLGPLLFSPAAISFCRGIHRAID